MAIGYKQVGAAIFTGVAGVGTIYSLTPSNKERIAIHKQCENQHKEYLEMLRKETGSNRYDSLYTSNIRDTPRQIQSCVDRNTNKDLRMGIAIASLAGVLLITSPL